MDGVRTLESGLARSPSLTHHPWYQRQGRLASVDSGLAYDPAPYRNRPLPDLGDAQLHRPHPSIPGPAPITVAVGDASRVALAVLAPTPQHP